MKSAIKQYILLLVLPIAFTLTSSDSGEDGVCPSIDPIGYTVLLPNPENCATFFTCSMGVPILMHCPDGLYFDGDLDVCGFVSATDCRKVRSKSPCYSQYDEQVHGSKILQCGTCEYVDGYSLNEKGDGRCKWKY